MKQILISIKPKYCLEILNKEKTMALRKTHPLLTDNEPFLVYVYCTGEELLLCKNPKNNYVMKVKENADDICLNKKVIGKFTCKNVIDLASFEPVSLQKMKNMQHDEIVNYIETNRKGYAWEISNLHIYKHPKSLDEFSNEIGIKITKPPMSWRYLNS